MSETRILIRLLRMYFPRNWEFGSALSKLRNFGGGGGGDWLKAQTPLIRPLVVNFHAQTEVLMTIGVCLNVSDLPLWILYWRRYTSYLRGDADKSLARPERKQATATEIRIYSTYSPRSSINFLAVCSNLGKPLKKTFRSLFYQPGIRGSNDLRVGRRKANIQLFFSVQGTGGSPTGPDPENRLGDRTLEHQVGQFLGRCNCPVRQGVVVQEQVFGKARTQSLF
jgi:hypothetical protein